MGFGTKKSTRLVGVRAKIHEVSENIFDTLIKKKRCHSNDKKQHGINIKTAGTLLEESL